MSGAGQPPIPGVPAPGSIPPPGPSAMDRLNMLAPDSAARLARQGQPPPMPPMPGMPGMPPMPKKPNHTLKTYIPR
jgi:hypothetical protein